MQNIVVHLPKLFSQFTDGHTIHPIDGAHSVMSLLTHLTEKNPELTKYFFTPDGDINSQICLFVNDQLIIADAYHKKLPENAVVKVVLPMVGG